MTAIDTVNVVPATPLGNAGDDIGNNILMGNGVDVSFDDLKQVPIPEDTATYTAVPHEDFVHSMYKHADRILSPKGFKLDGERYRTDKNGIIHCSVGKVGFDATALKENVEALLADLKKAKPSTSKGVYIKRVTLSTTMGPGVQIDQASLNI
mgnify:CR=1 FL=1